MYSNPSTAKSPSLPVVAVNRLYISIFPLLSVANLVALYIESTNVNPVIVAFPLTVFAYPFWYFVTPLVSATFTNTYGFDAISFTALPL